MKNILVTGGAGFIGSNIVDALLERGHRVAVLDDLSTGKVENIDHHAANPDFTFYRGTILDSGMVRSIIKSHGISHICHQAAIPSVSKSILDPVATTSANVVGTVTLLDIAAECHCKRIVYASSSSIYGDTPELPKHEGMQLNPKSPYAVSKAAKELLARVFAGLYGMETIGLRYFNVYGRRQDPLSDYAAVVPKFVTKALNNEPITIEGDGSQTRDFTYIDDVVQANLNALSADNHSPSVYNVAYGQRISVCDLAKLIVEITGSRSDITYTAARPGDVKDSLADIERAKGQLDYAPSYDIRKGLEQTIAWFKHSMMATAHV